MDQFIRINAPVITACFQFEKAEAKQLLCILKGETSSFRISPTSNDSSICKIRFVHDTFKAQLIDIRQMGQELQLRRLCSLLVAEVASGRVIVESKAQNGDVYAVTSNELSDHAKTKKYTNVTCEKTEFFEEIAKTFEENLMAVLAQSTQANIEQKKEDSHLETAKKEIDRKIIIAPKTNWSIASMFFGMVETIFDIFKPAISKIQDKMIEDSREQARLSHQDQLQERKKEKRRKHEERQKEAVKQSIALDERKLSIRKDLVA